MARLLILLAAAYLLARGLQAAVRQLTAGGSTTSQPDPTGSVQVAGKLVRCEVCKIHVPENRALRDGKLAFCSEACRRKAAAAVVF